MSDVRDPVLREQLSAWLDGALDPAQARFLERRLGNDPALREQAGRWRVASDVLRGERVRATPVAAAVAARIAAEAVPAQPAAAGRRRGPWPWLATAAALALAAVLWPSPSLRAPPALAATPVPSAPRVTVPAKPTPLLPVTAAALAADDASRRDVSELPLADGLPLRPWPRASLPPGPATAGAMMLLPPVAGASPPPREDSPRDDARAPAKTGPAR